MELDYGVRAQSRHVRISPQKVRLVLDQVRGTDQPAPTGLIAFGCGLIADGLHAILQQSIPLQFSTRVSTTPADPHCWPVSGGGTVFCS